MSLPVKIDLTIALETALSVGAGGTMGVLADKSALRDGYDRLIIPGSQVKGRVRHACEAIARALDQPICEAPRPDTMCPQTDDPRIPRLRERPDEPERPKCLICQIFGSPAYPGPLRFNDLVFADPVEGKEPGEARTDAVETLRPGIGLNRRRGVVAEGLLFFVETTPIWQGEDRPCFRNEEAIVGTVPSEKHLQLLLAGLRYLYSWGGGKSRGMGWGVTEAKASHLENGQWVEVPLNLSKLKEL